MRQGTNHFYDLYSAWDYYKDYGYSNVREAVQRKLDEGEIVLGPPPTQPGDTLRLIDGHTRYEIERRKA